MSYNKPYNSRLSGRFNTPGHFVPAQELAGGSSHRRGGYMPRSVAASRDFGNQAHQQHGYSPMRKPYMGHTLPQSQAQKPQPQQPHTQQPQTQQPQTHQPQSQQQQSQQQQSQQQQSQQQQSQQPQSQQQESQQPESQQPQSQPQQQQQQQQQFPLPKLEPTTPSDDVDQKMDCATADNIKVEDGTPRPSWMKPKLPGVKKISNKERRRRQNAHLRRLLTPKNALMALNELLLNEQIPNDFKVEPTSTKQFYNQVTNNFCADLTVEGQVYKGYGETKLTARNAAAEQAIRDIMIKKMSKILNSDGSLNGDAATDEEALPMIQLASFALHKLFTEWECEGHKVPQLKPPPATGDADAEFELGAVAPVADTRKKKAKPRALPLNASTMHPCMLLTYMRPQQEYRELGVAGDRPQNMIFTVGVHVDGEVYIGKAANKKEARRAAARAACAALFGVTFAERASDATPQLAPAAPAAPAAAAAAAAPKPAA